MHLMIIIPAFNEENRIVHTLEAYTQFYTDLKKKNIITTEFVVVLNGCSDNTEDVVTQFKRECHEMPIHVISLPHPGKGRAIKAGFEYSLQSSAQLIGFVDADMATTPSAFHDLVKHIDDYDGIIASRYMRGSQVLPARPAIKRYGSKLIYEKMISLLLGLHCTDYQCGAKLFKRSVIETITPHLTIAQWAFDVEILYLCKIYHYHIHEIPTIWHDRHESKLKIMRNGFRMLISLLLIKIRHRDKA